MGNTCKCINSVNVVQDVDPTPAYHQYQKDADEPQHLVLADNVIRGMSQYDALKIAEQKQNEKEAVSSNAQRMALLSRTRSSLTDESTEAASATPMPSEVDGEVSLIVEEVPYMLEHLESRNVCVHSTEKLSNYSILANVDISRKLRLVESAWQNEVLDRAMGSMCGMGIGDAMGHMFEFLPAQDEPGRSYFSLKSFKFYGEQNTFGLQYGQWTDDASMGLCMADSLILQRDYDGGDMRARFWCWWHKGYNNAFRLDRNRLRSGSVGLGGNISKSLDDMSRLGRGVKPAPIFNARGEDAGNGSLMRFSPIAIFFHAAPDEDLYEYARKSSYTTHPGIVAAEACSFLAHLIKSALHRNSEQLDVKRFLEEAAEGYLQKSGLQTKSGWGYDEMKWLVTGSPVRATERCWRWRDESLDIAATLKARGDTYNGYPVSSGYFGSYSLDGLAMALWAVYHTTSFNEAIAKSINLCGDADSHGSIAGQLAGALYGYSTINEKFLKWLNRWDEHEFAVRAVLLHELGSQWANSNVNH